MNPLEINKKIAEKMGCKWKESPRGSTIWINDEECPDQCVLQRNWAESISDAWELFEEMPDCLVGKAELLVNKWVVQDFSERQISQADTAPLAICLAWIAWKGQNDS